MCCWRAADQRRRFAGILRFVRGLAGDERITIDADAAAAEQAAGFRNLALASYMRAFGNLHHPVEQALGSIFTSARSA